MEDDIINNNCWSKVKQGCASEYRKCKNLCDEFGILVFVLLCICGVIVFVAGVESEPVKIHELRPGNHDITR